MSSCVCIDACGYCLIEKGKKMEKKMEKDLNGVILINWSNGKMVALLFGECPHSRLLTCLRVELWKHPRVCHVLVHVSN